MGQIRLKNVSGRTSKVGQQVKLAPNSKTSFVIAELGDFGVIGTVAQSSPNGYSGLINLINTVVWADVIGKPSNSTELTPEQITAIAAQIPPTDITNKVDKVSGSSLMPDTAITDLTDGGETTLHTHAGSGLTLATVKADTDIASAISLKHALQDLSGLQVTTAKGAANGYAPLDASSKVPIANLPDTILGSVNYHGTFSAAGGINPTVTPLALQGDYFVISTGGTISTVVYAIGDWIIYSGTAWERVDNSDKVSSVNGAQGAVVLNQDNIGDGTTYKQYSNTEKTKLAGLTAQVQTDWNALIGMGVLLNKPTISGSNTGDSAGHSGLVATSVTVNAKALSSNIVLTPDDLDDTSTTHKFAAGSNTGDETAARIATIVTGAGVQTTPLDADEFPFYKIVGTVLSKVTWANPQL